MVEKNIFIFTHYLYHNWGEYLHYVSACSYRDACIKLFKYFNCRENLYEIMSLIGRYYGLTDDQIGYNKLDHEDDELCERQIHEIIERLYRDYIYDDDPEITEERMFQVINAHVYNKEAKDSELPPFKPIKSLNHCLRYITCENLSNKLIT